MNYDNVDVLCAVHDMNVEPWSVKYDVEGNVAI